MTEGRTNERTNEHGSSRSRIPNIPSLSNDPPAPELLGELHSGIPELGLELGFEAKENGSGAKLLTQGDDSDEEEEEEEAEE